MPIKAFDELGNAADGAEFAGRAMSFSSAWPSARSGEPRTQLDSKRGAPAKKLTLMPHVRSATRARSRGCASEFNTECPALDLHRRIASMDQAAGEDLRIAVCASPYAIERMKAFLCARVRHSRAVAKDRLGIQSVIILKRVFKLKAISGNLLLRERMMRKLRSTEARLLPMQSPPVQRSALMRSTESVSADGVVPSEISIDGTVCIPFTDICVSVEVSV